ncbi:MAG: hypothetical protein J3R72DRAFT_477142 [Linnemannia gamsii]|nr:MAG: hypothetical protein J3R72DRAFT_477142 [Linnemannia gamsii]
MQKETVEWEKNYLQREDPPHLLGIVIIAANQGDSGALGLGGNTDDKIIILRIADGKVTVFLLGETGIVVQAFGGQDETAPYALGLAVLVDLVLVVVVTLVATVAVEDDLFAGIGHAMFDVEHQISAAKLDLERPLGKLIMEWMEWWVVKDVER